MKTRSAQLPPICISILSILLVIPASIVSAEEVITNQFNQELGILFQNSHRLSNHQLNDTTNSLDDKSTLPAHTGLNLTFNDQNILRDDIRRQMESGAETKRLEQTQALDNMLALQTTKQTAASIPTIIFEHAGPTVTTVDFSGQLLNPLPDDANDDDENDGDDEGEVSTSSFYEEGGSNLRQKLIRRPKNFPSRLVTTGANNHQMIVPPTPSEFFQEPPGSELQSEAEPDDQTPLDNPAKISDVKSEQAVVVDSAKPQKKYPKSIKEAKKLAQDNTTPAKQSGALDLLLDELQKLKKSPSSNRHKTLSDASRSYDYEDVMATADDNEDDRVKRIRAKLLGKLERKSSSSPMSQRRKSTSRESSDDMNVSIPLHLLLLAALETKPAARHKKSKGDYAMGKNRANNSHPELIIDELNKSLIDASRKEFLESTGDLGNLLTRRRRRLEHQLKQANQADEDEQREQKQSQIDGEEKPEVRYDDEPTSESRMNSTARDYESTSASVSNSTVLEPALELNRKRRGNTIGGDTDQDEDFDVDQKVNEYADEKYDRSLEPSWMSSNKNESPEIVHSIDAETKPGSPVVDFDEEFEELDARTRRKLIADRKRAIEARKARRRRKQLSEKDYEANENKFLNDIQKDTSDNVRDVDITIKSIEDSIPNEPSGDQSASNKRKKKPTNDENDDDSEPDGDGPVPSTTTHEDADSEPDHNDAAGSSKLEQWKPSTVDKELHDIEEESKRGKWNKHEIEVEPE